MNFDVSSPRLGAILRSSTPPDQRPASYAYTGSASGSPLNKSRSNKLSVGSINFFTGLTNPRNSPVNVPKRRTKERLLSCSSIDDLDEYLTSHSAPISPFLACSGSKVSLLLALFIFALNFYSVITRRFLQMPGTNFSGLPSKNPFLILLKNKTRTSQVGALKAQKAQSQICSEWLWVNFHKFRRSQKIRGALWPQKTSVFGIMKKSIQ